MNIRERLRNTHSLSANEQTLAEYLLKHTTEAVEMDYRQLSEQCHVSISCIFRLCRKMEVKGFNELKLLLSKELNEELSQYQNVDFSVPFSSDDSLESLTANIANIYKQTVDDTLRMLDFKEFRAIVETLTQARRIFFIGSGSNLLIGRSLMQKLQGIGVNIQMPSELTDGRLVCSTADRDSVALVVSYAGISSYMLECVKALRMHEAKIVLISSRLDPKLHYYADYRLFLCSKENPQIKIANFSSACSAQFLCDLIFSAYFQQHYDQFWQYRKKKTYL